MSKKRVVNLLNWKQAATALAIPTTDLLRSIAEAAGPCPQRSPGCWALRALPSFHALCFFSYLWVKATLCTAAHSPAAQQYRGVPGQAAPVFPGLLGVHELCSVPSAPSFSAPSSLRPGRCSSAPGRLWLLPVTPQASDPRHGWACPHRDGGKERKEGKTVSESACGRGAPSPAAPAAAPRARPRHWARRGSADPRGRAARPSRTAGSPRQRPPPPGGSSRAPPPCPGLTLPSPAAGEPGAGGGAAAARSLRGAAGAARGRPRRGWGRARGRAGGSGSRPCPCGRSGAAPGRLSRGCAACCGLRSLREERLLVLNCPVSHGESAESRFWPERSQKQTSL